MRQSSIMLLNTATLYAKIVINAFVTLFSTRFALQALGVDSFGLYSLIVGVLVMLTFFNHSLLVSVQRFFSIAMGEKNKLKLAKIFNYSIIIHLLLSIILFFSLKTLDTFLFANFLNVKPEMVETAIKVYNLMIISSVVTILSVPYSGAINAHEDMWFFSLSEITVALLKLFAAFYILYSKNNDLLLIFTFLNLIAISVGFAMKLIWSRLRYEECRINFKFIKDKVLFLDMLSFAGWNTLGVISVLFRNQGVAIVLNLFFGTTVNAAYGVANQLNGLVLVFASTLTTVFTPMIIRSKGEQNNEKMLFLSILSSKMSFFVSSLLSLPLLIFIPFILDVWLNIIPPDTVIFCRGIVLTFLILQLYPGITRGIYAEGDIKWYQIIISIILFSTLPIGYFLLRQGYPPYSIIIVMIAIQALTLIATIYFAGIKINLNIFEFLKNSVAKPVIFFVFCIIVGNIMNYLLFGFVDKWILFILTSTSVITLYFMLYYKFVFKEDETKLFVSLFRRILKRG